MPDKRFDVQGRTAVITGGSGHFGRAMASALSQADAQVVILGRHVETAQTVAEAAVANFTQWLAVHMAQEYSPSIRVKTHPRN